MLSTQGIHFQYPEGDSFHFPDITLKDKEHLVILGPSGAGKTTLLHLLSGLLPVTKGSIKIHDTEISSLGRQELDRFRATQIGLIFQRYHFIKSLNLEENLALRQYYPGKQVDKKRRTAIIERLGLQPHLKKKVTQLSQGQQQRLSIALGLIHQPKVVFADEPTSNLDDDNCKKVLELLKEEAELSSSSLVIITHDQRVKTYFKNQIVL